MALISTVASRSPCSPLLGLCLVNRFQRHVNGLIWPKVGYASTAYAATAAIDFLPLPAAPSFLAKQERFSAVNEDTEIRRYGVNRRPMAARDFANELLAAEELR